MKLKVLPKYKVYGGGLLPFHLMVVSLVLFSTCREDRDMYSRSLCLRTRESYWKKMYTDVGYAANINVCDKVLHKEFFVR